MVGIIHDLCRVLGSLNPCEELTKELVDSIPYLLLG